jgi:predicted  nucleic acid-binding Zn-ribbon protein
MAKIDDKHRLEAVAAVIALHDRIRELENEVYLWKDRYESVEYELEGLKSSYEDDTRRGDY